ncbi:hypothetical protein UT300005_06800 [Clostridium sp. CTA-5]
MNSTFLKKFIIFIITSILCGLVIMFIGYLISLFTTFLLKDILFVEGILVIILVILMSISGKPLGLSMQAFGTNNAQYVGTANLKVTEKENELLKNKDSFNINFDFNSISIILGAIFILIISYFI